jgi:hypothetical protein
MFGRPKTERIQAGNRARTHGEYVTQDSTDTGGRALVGLNVARMVVALHLEDHGVAIADIDNACVFARPLNHPCRLGRQGAQMDARGFIRAVLVPHRRENPEFRESRHATDQLEDSLILVRFEPVGSDEFGGDLRLV